MAKLYIATKKPIVVAVAGSVGKTSTKLILRELIRTERRVSCMDDSYNNGLGLYLSVFEQKIPTKQRSISSWLGLMAKSIRAFFTKAPEVIILEYGIDRPGDMSRLIKFIRPDISILTAVTPEHMEFLGNIDTVGKEESVILRETKLLAVASVVDVDSQYLDSINYSGYGSEQSLAFHEIDRWNETGYTVSFFVEDWALESVPTKFISEALIRQMSGALLVAKRIGITKKATFEVLASIEPAAGRMRVLKGKDGSTLVDDTANFSPNAGIEALKSIKKIPARQHIAILGNMHELGNFQETGFSAVASEFPGIDTLLLVGNLSTNIFGRYARGLGFVPEKTLFSFDNAIDAGVYASTHMNLRDAVILVKGPFGGYYLEETTRLLLRDAKDWNRLTRQSEFWQRTKKQHFGKKYNPPLSYGR